MFWNKEDPVSFDLFLPAAKAFDIVLTTDADMIDGYRRATGHERVAACRSPHSLDFTIRLGEHVVLM